MRQVQVSQLLFATIIFGTIVLETVFASGQDAPAPSDPPPVEADSGGGDTAPSESSQALSPLFEPAGETMQSNVTTTVVANQVDVTQSEESRVGSFSSPPDISLSTGAATLSFPIEVPPGRNGLAPSIRLYYNSYRKNGWVGVGWDLNLGAIQRSVKKGLDYSTDNYEVISSEGSGQELVIRSEWNGVNLGGDYFGTRIEADFTRFRYYRGEKRWTAVTRDGMTYTYGTSASSRQESSAGIFKWHLDRIEDTNGNFLTLSYDKPDGSSGRLYPKRIDYTGNVKAGVSGTRSVRFITVAGRSDVQTSYVSRSAISTTRLLERIEIYADDHSKHVRTYRFDYETGPSSQLSQLKSIRLIGADQSTEKPPVKFEYTDGGTGPFVAADGWNDGGYRGKYHFPDLNGDGFHDYVVVANTFYKGECILHPHIARSDGTFSKLDDISFSYNSEYEGPPAFFFNDVNGDGADDLIVDRRGGTGICISNSDGSCDWSNTSKSILYGDATYFADFNGDGRSDILAYDFKDTSGTSWQEDLYIWFSNGDGSYTLKNTIRYTTGLGEYNNTPAAPRFYLGDVNGDGDSDFLIIDGTDKSTWLSNGDGSFEVVATGGVPKGSGDYNDHIALTDVNGDGLADMVLCRITHPLGQSYNSYVYLWVALSEGNGTFAPFIDQNLQTVFVYMSPREIIGPPVFGDINGDGRTDLIVQRDNRLYVFLARPDGNFNVNEYTQLTGGYNTTYRSLDINADGRHDLIGRSNNNFKTYMFQEEPRPDLLVRVLEGDHTKTDLKYLPTNGATHSQMPFILHAVSEVTTYDGLGDQTTVTYEYEVGKYDFDSREFRGFQTVRQKNPDLSMIETTFHQDDYRKGKTIKTRLNNSRPDGGILTETTFQWLADTLSGSNGQSAWVKLAWKKTVFDNDSALCTREDNIYHAGCGRVSQTKLSGTDAKNVVYEYDHVNKGEWAWRLEREAVKYAGEHPDRETTYVYDSRGNITQQVFSLPEASENPFVRMEYDPDFGTLTRYFDALNYMTETIYDNTQTHPYRVINPLNHIIETIYDDRYGKVSLEKDIPNSTSVAYAFDPFGRVRQVDYPDGGRTVNTFDDHSVPRSITTNVLENADTGDTVQSRSYYDILGRPVGEVASGRDGAGTADQTVVTGIYYDKMGRIKLKEGPYFGSGWAYGQTPIGPHFFRSFLYDQRGRPVQIYGRLGQTSFMIIDKKTTYSYKGFETVITDPDRCVKTEKRDHLGRIIAVIEHTSTANLLTQYAYNAADDLLKITNATGIPIKMNYDSMGRKTSLDDPDMGFWRYEYDKNNNLKKQTDANEHIIEFDYDELNRLRFKRYPNADAAVNPTVEYTYDTCPTYGVGRLHRISNTFVTRTIDQYDAMGRVLQESKTITGAPKTFTTAYSYDPSGKPDQMVFDDGYTLEYAFYPGTNLLHTVTGIDTETVAHARINQYDPHGKIADIEHANGTRTQYTYYGWSARLATIKTSDANDTILQDRKYLYSPDGDIGSIEDIHRDILYRYSYDKLHRLTSETTYSDNETNATQLLMPQQYDNIDHIHAVSSVNFNGKSYSYTYDENGNMTVGWDFTDPTEPARRDILYNVDNMPYRIDRTTGTTTTALELTYDGENSRAKTVIPGGSTTFYINENHELIDGISHKYVYAGNLRVALIKDSDVYYYHKDHLGSSVIVTERATGESKESTEYLPYGGNRSHTGTVISDYKFTDQELDRESGLYNYNARLYDPMIGRFISADSFVPDPYDPQSLNRYSYARNNPLRYVDPSGHQPGDFADWNSSLPDPQPNMGFTSEVNAALARATGYGAGGGAIADALAGVATTGKLGIPGWGTLFGFTIGLFVECVDDTNKMNKELEEEKKRDKKDEPKTVSSSATTENQPGNNNDDSDNDGNSNNHSNVVGGGVINNGEEMSGNEDDGFNL